MTKPVWNDDPEWWSAIRGMKADCGSYELVAFDIGAQNGLPRITGWEIFTGPKLQDLVVKGETDTFEEAQAAAEAAWLQLITPSGAA